MDAQTDSLSVDTQGQFADQIAGWKNGQSYTAMVTLTQTAPGKFDVTALTAHDDAENPSETADANEESDMPMARKSKTGNPAVDGMMS